MIKRLIKNIRRQPKGKRDSIAMGIAGTFTAMVFMVWLYHMPARIVAITDKKVDDSSPGFTHLFDEVKNQAAAVKSSFSENNKDDNSTSTEPFAVPEDKSPFGIFSSSTVSATSSVVNSSSSQESDIQPVISTTSSQSGTPAPREVRIVTTGLSSSTATSSAEGM